MYLLTILEHSGITCFNMRIGIVLNNNNSGGVIIPFHSIMFATMAIAVTAWVNLASASANSIPTPLFDGAAEETSSSGQISLRWRLQDLEVDSAGLIYHVEMAESADFSDAVTWYTGEDLATYLSGLPDGNFYFRVRTLAAESDAVSAWSATKRVTVQHHSLQFALLLCALGAVVFFSTVAVIAHGTLRAER